MRLRIAAALFTLFLAVALVIAGFSAAWFTAEDSLPSATAFLVGTVDLEITGEEAQPAEFRWEVEEGKPCRDFTWTMENTGSKGVFMRARLEETLLLPGADETAWGEGTRFVNPGNWAMYFLYDVGDHDEDNPRTVRLLAGQHHEAGTVKAWEGQNDDGEATLFVEYAASGWQMAEVHLAVADKLELIPKNKPGNPQVGRFPFKDEFDGLKQTHTFALPIQGKYPAGALKGRDYNWTGATILYLAAHAVVMGASLEDEAGMNWSQRDDCDFAWEYNEDDGYWYYCREPVAPGEEIRLCLTGFPQKAGLYTVKLYAGAVQALPEAVAARWGVGLPCLQGH